MLGVWAFFGLLVCDGCHGGVGLVMVLSALVRPALAFLRSSPNRSMPTILIVVAILRIVRILLVGFYVKSTNEMTSLRFTGNFASSHVDN